MHHSHSPDALVKAQAKFINEFAEIEAMQSVTTKASSLAINKFLITRDARIKNLK